MLGFTEMFQAGLGNRLPDSPTNGGATPDNAHVNRLQTASTPKRGWRGRFMGSTLAKETPGRKRVVVMEALLACAVKYVGPAGDPCTSLLVAESSSSSSLCPSSISDDE